MIEIPINETIEVNAQWISQLRSALEEVLQSESEDPKKPLNWSATELQWDKSISWLQDMMSQREDALAYWLLLWMACDITHGFWFKARDRSLSDMTKWSNFSWSCRARVGAMDVILGHQPPLSSKSLIQAFSNPLLFQLNPSIVIVDWPEGDSLDGKKVVLERAWQLLGLPLKIQHVTQLQDVLTKMDSLAEKGQVNSDEWKAFSHSLFASDTEDLMTFLLHNTPDKLKSSFHSNEEFQALCSSWRDFAKSARMAQEINQQFKKIQIVDEGGMGSPVLAY